MDLGYGDRFGIVYFNFESLERTPKLSADWVPRNGETERRGLATNREATA